MVQIRPATVEDFDELLVLFQQLWPTKPILPERMREVYARIMATPYRRYICAVDCRRIVGMGSLTLKDNLWQEGVIGFVDELVVHEDYRGKGVGGLLLEHLICLARKHDCRRLELDSAFHRLDAHRFYEQHEMTKRAFLFTLALDNETS